LTTWVDKPAARYPVTSSLARDGDYLLKWIVAQWHS